MRNFRKTALLLTLLLCVALTLPAQADVVKGKVTSGVYDNGAGISFPVPDGFSLSKQENKNAGFFRLTFSGPRDKNGFGPALLIDVIPGVRDMEAYEDVDLVVDLLDTYGGGNYEDMYLIASDTFTEYGVTGRRVFLVYRDSSSQNRTCYLTIYAFCSERNTVRIAYDCYGAQRTLVKDLRAVDDLYNTILVP